MRVKLTAGALCLGSLWTCSGSTTLATASASGHRGELVRVEGSHRTGGGGEFGPKCSRTVRTVHVELRIDGVTRDVTRDFGDGATSGELVVAPDGERFAYRASGGGWRPAWRGKTHVLLGGDAQRLSTASVDFASVPGFASAARDVFRHAKNERSLVVEELRGTPELGKLLADTMDAEGELNDEWSRAFRALPAPEQKPIVETLEKRVTGGAKERFVLLRYANELGIRSERERAPVLETLTQLPTHGLPFRVKERLVVQAARVDATATAEWACREVARYRVDANFYPTELYWVMAKARHSCPAALPQLQVLGECVWRESETALDGRIESALGKLVDDPAHAGARFVENREALVAFAVRTLSPEERARHCAKRAPE